MRFLEARTARIGREPVTGRLLVLAKSCRGLAEILVEVGGWLRGWRSCAAHGRRHPHGQRSLLEVMSLPLPESRGEGGQAVHAGSEAGSVERDAPAGGA